MEKYLIETLQHHDWYSGKKGAHPTYGNPADKDARRAFFDLVEQEKPESILDVGCGKGQDSRPIRALGVRYVGVDPFEFNINWARKRYPEADFRLGFIQELPFEDGSFDWVWLMGVLMYIRKDQLELGFAECSRVARKRIYICGSSRKGSTLTERYNVVPRHLPLKMWRVSYHPYKGTEYLMWEIRLDEEIESSFNPR